MSNYSQFSVNNPVHPSHRSSTKFPAAIIGTVVALFISLSFTIFLPKIAYAQLFCNADIGGNEDENQGQTDLTRFCIDESGAPTIISVGWQWDDL